MSFKKLAPLLLAALFLSTASTAQAPTKLADLPAVFVTLGTGGGPVLQTERSQPANAVVVGDNVYLFDAGDGVQRQLALAHLPVARIRAIFLSHHHIDHDSGLAPLLLARWLLYNDKPLPILGPPGTVGLINGIATAYRSAEVARLSENAPIKPSIASTLAPKDLAPEINAPELVYQDENLRVLAITNDHYHFSQPPGQQPLARSYAYRIETAHRTFVFTGDTGPSPHVELLAQNADVLVSEVINLVSAADASRALARSPAEFDGLMEHMRQDHLAPQAVGELAAKAHVKELVLTHLAGFRDGDRDLTPYTQGIDKFFHGPVHLANDLDRW